MTTDRWSAIERIFHEALERPPEARAAFLTESCGGDEQLRREVQSLLDNATLPEFLEQPALQVAAGMATGPGVASLIGQRIGVYQIQVLLGRGGMGEVYRARDTKLNRDVALKVLPASVAGDLERLARFRREARVLAALNHPNIAHIHGLEDTSSAPALVMELVDGPTLADRLATNRGLALSDTLAIARQIANALEAAHAHQIIHRDLKPGNIKVRDDGTVKVLDFGLAKVLASTGSGDVETLTALDTQAGLVMGTPAYMSPEQARGAAVDERTDIWAFGCVLYELLSGRRTFVGDSAVQILNAVIEREPDWTAISHVPPAIQKLVRRCLQKDSRRRLRDIGDARLELEDAETVGDTPHAGGTGKPRRPWLWMNAGLSAGLIVAAAAAFAYWRWQPASSEPRNVRFENVTDAVGLEESPAISPDGKMVAFTAFSGGRRQLFVRALAGGVSRQVTNDDLDHEHPRWAPDSTTILYLGRSASGDHSALYEIPFIAGPSRPIAPALTGGDISPLDGQKIAVFQTSGAIVKLVVIRRDGILVNEVVARTPGRQAERTPRWAPDGRSIAYIDSGPLGFDDAINVVSAGGGAPHGVVQDHVRGLSWLPDGSGLVFGSAQGSTVPYPPTFQLRVIRLSGAANEQLTYGVDSLTDPDVHESGLVLATRTTMNSAIWKMPATGTPAVNQKDARIVTHLTSQVQTPSLSPDARELVYLSDSGGHGNLWVIGTDGEGRRQLTYESDPSVKVAVPVWSPVGSTIAFLKIDGARNEQWLVNSDGTNLRRLLEDAISASWSPDGKWIYYASTGTGGTCIQKIRLADKIVEIVRCGNVIKPLPRKDGTLFFESRFVATSGGFNSEFRKASPENSPDTTLLGRTDARQIAFDSRLSPPSALSADGHWVALALMNRATTNLWRMSTDSGKLQQVTDFDRATWIVRQVTWSPDSRFIYAAIADLDADVMSIAGVVSGKGK